MYVQWCAKGIPGLTKAQAEAILAARVGLVCRWWRNMNPLPMDQVSDKLTLENLDRHVNAYSQLDPQTGRPFCDATPFISLTAGTVDRDLLMKTTVSHTAAWTAAMFATEGGQRSGHIFVCYVIVALNQAIAIEAVCEEIREIKTYRRYSPYYVEGEVTAKIRVPAAQILMCAEVRPDLSVAWWTGNPNFAEPSPIFNQRTFV